MKHIKSCESESLRYVNNTPVKLYLCHIRIIMSLNYTLVKLRIMQFGFKTDLLKGFINLA